MTQYDNSLLFPVFRTEDGYHLYRVVGDQGLPVWVDNLDPTRVDLTYADDNGLPAAARHGLIGGALTQLCVPPPPAPAPGMSVEQIKAAASAAEAVLRRRFKGPPGGVELTETLKRQGIQDIPLLLRIGHLLWCCDQIQRLADAGRREKAFRWLGFVQGVLWTVGLASITELKAMNKPHEQTKIESRPPHGPPQQVTGHGPDRDPIA